MGATASTPGLGWPAGARHPGLAAPEVAGPDPAAAAVTAHGRGRTRAGNVAVGPAPVVPLSQMAGGYLRTDKRHLQLMGKKAK